MRRMVKCYGHYCYLNNIKHDKSNLIYYHHRNYCDKCYRYLKRTKRDRNELYFVIKQYTHVSFPTGGMLRNIKLLKQNYHYTYKGIMYSLQYLKKNKRGFNFNNMGFLNYVPFIYEKAQNWKFNLRPVQDIEYNKIAMDDSRLGEKPKNDVTKVSVNHRDKKKKYDGNKKFDIENIMSD